MNIYEKLMHIQTNLVASKGEFNAFGKYKYRSLENILESLKPLLKEYNCAFKLDNDVVVIGELLFRKSTASLINVEKPEEVVNSVMFTRECLDKKGMSVEQCSGSTASYSDKYATQKLFAIDDTKDADTQDNSGEGVKPEIVPDNLDDYVIPVGKNKGKKLSEMDRKDIEGFVNWVDDKKVTGKAKQVSDVMFKYLQG